MLGNRGEQRALDHPEHSQSSCYDVPFICKQTCIFRASKNRQSSEAQVSESDLTAIIVPMLRPVTLYLRSAERLWKILMGKKARRTTPLLGRRTDSLHNVFVDP
jgi:hypothetical protein